MRFYARFQYLFSIMLVLSILLAACGAAGLPQAGRGDTVPTQAQATNTPSTMETASVPTDIPPTTAGLEEYTSDLFGFKLSYPSGFEVENSIYHTFIFITKRTDLGHRERAFLNVELTGGQTAEWFANKIIEDNANLGLNITTWNTKVDGQPAVVVSGVSGQDINRQVFVVYKGNLYHFYFVPDDPQTTDQNIRSAYQEMEALYGAVMNTFRFLPERLEVPPVLTEHNMIYQIEQAVEARSQDDVHRMLGDEFMLLEWLNPSVSSFPLAGSEAVNAILNNHTSQTPNLVFTGRREWPEVAGSPFAFTGYFPEESVFPFLVQGWGLQGNDEAVIILGRYPDGNLYWRGMLIADGKFIQ